MLLAALLMTVVGKQQRGQQQSFEGDIQMHGYAKDEGDFAFLPFSWTSAKLVIGFENFPLVPSFEFSDWKQRTDVALNKNQ